MWNLKCDTNELTYETETVSHRHREQKERTNEKMSRNFCDGSGEEV